MSKENEKIIKNAKAYSPADIEDALYQNWLDKLNQWKILLMNNLVIIVL